MNKQRKHEKYIQRSPNRGNFISREHNIQLLLSNYSVNSGNCILTWGGKIFPKYLRHSTRTTHFLAGPREIHKYSSQEGKVMRNNGEIIKSVNVADF